MIYSVHVSCFSNESYHDSHHDSHHNGHYHHMNYMDTLNCYDQCCMNFASCSSDSFKVYFIGTNPIERNITSGCMGYENSESKWLPTEYVTSNLSDACIVFMHPIQNSKQCRKSLHELPSWNIFGAAGRNHVIWISNDNGIDQFVRHKTYGLAAIAQGHSLYWRYVPGLDVPISLKSKGKGPDGFNLFYNSSSLQMVLPHNRKWLLTFKGTETSKFQSGISQFDNISRKINICTLPITCVRNTTANNTEYCQNKYQNFSNRSYIDLFNSTFGLIIPGRSPATMRLHEVMSTSSIPVFFGYDDSPLPYEDLIPWADISFFINKESNLGTIIPLLEKMKYSDQIIDMFRLVKFYYNKYFSSNYDQNKRAVIETYERRFTYRDTSRSHQIIRRGCDNK